MARLRVLGVVARLIASACGAASVAMAQTAAPAGAWQVAPAITTSLEAGPAVCLNADAAAQGGFRAEAFRGEITTRCENLIVFEAQGGSAALAFPGIVGGERYNCRGLQLASAHPCNSGFFAGPETARELDVPRVQAAIEASGADAVARDMLAAFRTQQADAARAAAAIPPPPPPDAAPPPPPQIGGAPGPYAQGAPGGPVVMLPGGPMVVMPGAGVGRPGGPGYAGATAPYGAAGGTGGMPSSIMLPAGRPPQYLDLLRCAGVAEAMQTAVMSAGRAQERAYWGGEYMRLHGQYTATGRAMRLDDRMLATDYATTRPMAQQMYLGGARDGDRGTFLEVDLAYCRGRGLLR